MPHVPVGFDYKAAVLELRRILTNSDISEYMGYDSRDGIRNILKGGIPSHLAGEALYVLYISKFGRKPPMSAQQATGSFAIKTSQRVSFASA